MKPASLRYLPLFIILNTIGPALAAKAETLPKFRTVAEPIPGEYIVVFDEHPAIQLGITRAPADAIASLNALDPQLPSAQLEAATTSPLRRIRTREVALISLRPVRRLCRPVTRMTIVTARSTGLLSQRRTSLACLRCILLAPQGQRRRPLPINSWPTRRRMC